MAWCPDTDASPRLEKLGHWERRAKQAVWEAATMCPAPCKLTFDLLDLESAVRVSMTRATSVPILVFPGLSVLDLGPMYATDRRQTSDAHHRLMPPTLGAGA